MARRDVDLVIKARDEAQGTIRAITGALADFVKGQKTVKQAAGDTDSALTRLSTGLKNLKDAAGGLDVGAKLDRSLGKSEASVKGLVDALAQATRQASEYEAQVRDAASATEKLRQESGEVAEAIKRQKGAVEQAKDAQSRLNSITREAAKERARLLEADRRLTAQIEQQRGKLNGLASQFDTLAAEIAATTKPSAALEKRLASLDQRGQAAEAAFRLLEQTQAAVRASIDATARSVERANDLYGSQASSLDRQVAALDRMRAKQRELAGALDAAASNQSKLETEAQRTATSLMKQVAALDRTEASHAELQAAVAETRLEMSRVEATVRGPMLKAFAEQRKIVAELGTQYKASRAEATRLGAAIAKLGDAASDQLVAEFTAAQEASLRTEAAWREQAQAANALRHILRQTGGDLDEVAARQNRFATTLNGAAAAYDKFEKEAREAAQAQAQATAQAAAATQRLTAATRAQGAAARQAARETGTFAAAIRQFYGDSRTALSFTQRLRSEVLSLIAAYGGIFAVIEGVRNVVAAFQTLEAAQSRLGTVFEGDQAKVGAELDFIRRNAERLGIEFGVLSDEYSKFAVATKGSNLEGAETRRIFIKVAEAARVMRLSQENVQGVMTALGQIASKGAVQMEELRQQLGDRLPGALQIMAAGLGVSSAKLIEMLENGEVTSDALSSFADELDRRFGDQVPDALENVTASMGRFQNAVFQAFLRIAQGGFIDRFAAMLDDITATLQSADFASFADKVSAALGTMADFLALAARNWDLLLVIASAFVALKLAPFLIVIHEKLGKLRPVLLGAAAGFRATTVAMSGATGVAGRFTAAMVAARAAITGLLASTGIGILAVVIGTAIGAWATSTDAATEALVEHQSILDDLRDAYDEVGGAVDKWREKVEDVSVTSLKTNLDAMEARLQDTKKAFEAAIPNYLFGPIVGGPSAAYADEARALFQTFEAGEIGIDDFSKRLDELAEKYRDVRAENKNLAATLDGLAKEIKDGTIGIQDINDALIAKTGSAEEAEAALKRLNRVVEEGADGFVDYAAQAEQFEAALEELHKFAPELAAELEKMTEAASLEAAYQSALRYAKTLEDVERAEVAYQAALRERDKKDSLSVLEGVGGDARSKAAALLRKKESFRGDAYWDENHWRVGYGSDTIRGGEKVTQQTKATLAEAEAEMVRRIDGIFQRLVGQIGEVRLDSFSSEQQAVLVSLAYNYGDLARTGILDVIRTGTEEEIVQGIRGLARHGPFRKNGRPVNEQRRLDEANIFESGQITDEASFEAFDKEREKAERERQQAEEERQRAAKATQDRLASNEEEIRQQQLVNDGRERNAAIEKAITAAKAENANLDDETLVKIGQQAGLLYDLQNSTKAREEAEERVNQLLELRSALTEQLQVALERGDSGTVGRLDEQLVSVNAQLVEATTNAIELLKPLAALDPTIAAAVARLETLRMSADTTASEIVISFQQVGDVFAGGMVNAFDSFLKKMHEGTSATQAAHEAFLEFAADFLRQIAMMILQQLALNAVKAIGKSMGFGVAHQGGIVGQSGARRSLAVVAHEGGVIGQAAPRRALDPAHFRNAMRHHAGGIAGLQPGEVPTVLQRNEEVLTRDDPRHIFNMRKAEGGGGSGQGVRVVNAFDGTSFLEQALKTREGEKIVLNFLKARGGAVRSAIGG